jgi:APA family basic amino acid/polyamine antiporter
MIEQAQRNDPLPLYLLAGYCAVGAVIYLLYGYRHSKLAKGIDITEDAGLETVADAMLHGVDDKKKD